LWGQDTCTAAEFSSDGRRLAIACGPAVTLWDVATRKPVGTLAGGGKAGITSLGFLPDDQKVVASSLDGALLVWDLTTLAALPRVIETQEGNLFALAVSPDGSTLALGGGPDGTIKRWSTTSWMPVDTPLNGLHGRIWSLSYSPDGALAAGTEDGSVVLWKNSMQRMTLAPAHRERVWKVAFSPDGRLLASAGEDGDVKLWNGQSAGALGSVSEQPAHADGALSLAFSPDGSLLATGGKDHRIVVWNLSTKKVVLGPTKAHRNSVLDIGFSPNGVFLASASQDHSVILWNLAEENPLADVLKGHKDPVYRIDFVKDRRTLVSQSTDGAIVIWDLQHGRPATTLQGGLGFVWFSQDFNVWAFAKKDGVQLVDMLNKKPLYEPLQGHKDEVIAGAFSPDGKTFATGSKDGTVMVWDISSGNAIGQALDVTTGEIGVTGVAFSPDGKVLATASQREIALWDVSSHRQIGIPLVGHEERRLVFGVDVGPDGKTLASSSFDGTIALWDASSRRQFGHLKGRHAQLYGLAFNWDGKTLASGAQDGTIALWKVDVDLWQSIACSIANRNLTHVEWEQYVGGTTPYIAVCPDLPHE
jgi:WD40 repeat protein